MKPGDLIRFMNHLRAQTKDDPWQIGILLDYNKTQKLGSVLHNGNILRLRGAQLQIVSQIFVKQDKTN
jgi:hypothetical protein